MTITRKDINSAISFEDYNFTRPHIAEKLEKVYTYDILEKYINAVKNILAPYIKDLDYTPSAIIGLHPSEEQIAAIFACLELGISIVIVDYDRPDKFKQYEYMDPKTDLLCPIDFFIVNSSRQNTNLAKYVFFENRCNFTICLDKNILDFTPNNVILAKDKTIAIKCTSSGTTNTPKKVEHTHEFLKNISYRNSIFYNNVVALGYNLNHGSSIATYFLPALFSKKTTKFLNIGGFGLNTFENFPDCKVDHFMISYTADIINFAKNKKLDDLTIYTLSSIPQKEVKGKFKDVISFFGSNETSGPTLVNKLSYDNFAINKFRKIDDFFKFDLQDGNLVVTIPIYNKAHNTNDIFSVSKDYFVFKGRNDIYRINGREVDKNILHDIVKLFLIKDFQIIYDIVENKIYIAYWNKKINDSKVLRRINKKLPYYHKINKLSFINVEEFMSGVKMDQELLREYFRKYV